MNVRRLADALRDALDTIDARGSVDIEAARATLADFEVTATTVGDALAALLAAHSADPLATPELHALAADLRGDDARRYSRLCAIANRRDLTDAEIEFVANYPRRDPVLVLRVQGDAAAVSVTDCLHGWTCSHPDSGGWCTIKLRANYDCVDAIAKSLGVRYTLRCCSCHRCAFDKGCV